MRAWHFWVCVCVIFIAERAELYSSVLLFAKFRQWSWLPPKIKVRRTRFLSMQGCCPQMYGNNKDP